jgi:hypothetical protein
MRHLPTTLAAAAARQELSDLTADVDGDSGALAAAVDDLDDIDPPDQVADAYRQVLDAYRAVAEAGSITDPDVAGHLADAQTATERIDDFVRQNCTDA